MPRAIKEMDWDVFTGQTVRIYRNLLTGMMSLQTKVPGRGWIVAGHTTEAIVANVTFHVSEAGRQRVIRDRCKNVHAWGQGVLIGAIDPSIEAPIALKYNPYTDETFVQRFTQQPITGCQYLVVRENLVFVSADAVPKAVTPPTLKVVRVRERRRLLTFNSFHLAAA